MARLTRIKTLDKAYKVTMMASMGIAAIALAIALIGFYKNGELSQTFIDELNKRDDMVIVIDKDNVAYAAKSQESSAFDSRRIFEYEHHVEMFVSLWYGIDQYTYDYNTEKALNLIGEVGKELLEEYTTRHVKETLQRTNQRNFVQVNKIKVNVDNNTGEIIFTIIGKKPKGKSTRMVKASFTFIDVGRSSNNPHGAQLETWKLSRVK